MATLKSYTCSKCAGILMFDADQEILDCPFCGNRYDIVEFHADEVLDQANACLKEGSFSAAKEKFGQILDNDPQNFDALLGTVLCALKLDSVERLENSDNLSGGEKLRLALARELLRDTDILLLDEPAASLDSEARQHFYALLPALCGRRTVIAIVHDPPEGLAFPVYRLPPRG